MTPGETRRRIRPGARAFRAACCALWLCLGVASAGAADVGLDLADVFNPGAARRPKAGEWLEYRVAYPVDPLENSLRGGSASSAARDDAIRLATEPPITWLSLPLRLEIIAAEEKGYQVRMTFANASNTLFLPVAAPKSGADFRYETPQPEDRRAVHRVGDRQYEVVLTRRQGPRYGFVRLTNPELPFGIARFATGDVDLILVGMGTGEAPNFPLPDSGRIDPPPGTFYQVEE